MHTNIRGGFGRSTSRREFLQTAGVSLGSLALAGAPAFGGILQTSRKRAILIYLAGGPSQIDMYDMKPDAPAGIRGEFRPIRTNVPGMRVCELLPLQATIADKFAIVNGVETIDSHRPAMFVSELTELNTAGCLHIQTPTLPHGDWDTHGRVLGRKLSIFEELRAKLPIYDRLIYETIGSIYQRGQQNDTLLVVCGEFGRTPWINEYGGRNHWATSGSVLFAGGGLRMGQVIGDTGPIGEREQVRSMPYTGEHVLAMIYRHLGVKAEALGKIAPIEELV